MKITHFFVSSSNFIVAGHGANTGRPAPVGGLLGDRDSQDDRERGCELWAAAPGDPQGPAVGEHAPELGLDLVLVFNVYP